MIRLVQIERDGVPAEPLEALPIEADQVLAMHAKLYINEGYEPPWVGYLALEDERCVGSCAFKSPPENGRVEIAYFTFPGHEGRGIASAMAKALVELAQGYDPTLTIAAQTLPEESASTALLSRLGFRKVAARQHPEDGLVWEWQLPTASALAGSSQGAGR